jgi:phenylacetate-CoA ligase
MLAFLNRHVVWPLVAAKRGSRHLHFHRLLERSQYDPPAVHARRQFLLLKAVVDHAYASVPYYRAAWDAAGVHPTDLTRLEDLRHFPEVTKADLRINPRAFHSDRVDQGRVRVKRTSGSTGVPLTIHLDEPAAQWKAACTLRSDQWSGYRLGQRVAKVWGNPEYKHHGLKGRLTNALLDRAVYLDTRHLTDERIERFTKSVRRHRPGLVFGHAHSLYLLALKLKKLGVDDVRPSGVIATAMPLHRFQRAVIEEVFGVPATDRYGSEETSLIASQCDRHAGLHVAAESVLTEVGPGGHLLVTDLVNLAMPLIRYRIGDVLSPGGPCPCGRGLPTIGGVMGRDADYVLTPDGGLVSGISLTENFALHIPGAAQVQVVQESLTRLTVRVVPDDGFTDTSRRKIGELVRDTFGPAVRHEILEVDAIPQEASGKYRFCVSRPAEEYIRNLSC